MNPDALANLARIGTLASRFDLAYIAAHAFALPTLRWHGYRSDNRYLIFQSLAHTQDVVAPSGGSKRTKYATSLNTQAIPTGAQF